MAESFKIDLESLTLNEIIALEELTGIGLTGIGDSLTSGKPVGTLLRAIALVVKRRENPDFTLEQAGELTVDFSPDPTTAAS